MPADNAQADSAFAKNRAEELDSDVWEEFVIPPFFDKLDLDSARKPRAFIGGRGCGKTMLLKYLSHQSMYSSKRRPPQRTAPTHIGLYWRVDTQFAKLMNGRGVEDDVWETAFNHLMSLILAIEIVDSLKSISHSESGILKREKLQLLNLTRLQSYQKDIPSEYNLFEHKLEDMLSVFQMWVNNVRTLPPPAFLPGSPFLLTLIEEIRAQLPELCNTTYFVYLDEYENLREYQQRIINTRLKHSETPLIFNLASKRYGFQMRNTVGEESIADIADFRTHDLDRYLADDFETFAGEIVLLRIAIHSKIDSIVDTHMLRDATALPQRRTKEYRQAIAKSTERIFPGMSREDLAKEVFSERALSNRLHTYIENALTSRGAMLPPDRFLRPTIASASIVATALLNRSSLDPTEVASEMDKLDQNNPNRFTGETGWIHNNFIGCLLRLYEPHSRACPFYAGFRTFCCLSRSNIRHLLELCHKSFSLADQTGQFANQFVSPLQQAEAARHASADFLAEVRGLGRRGNQLHTFVLRLGSLFAIAHKRPTQSEPEQCHFAIRGGHKTLTADDIDFLREAVKWSVLYEERETKRKGEYQPFDTEYVLNPIYAPFFHITYRKRRKLELSADEMLTIIRGTYDQVKVLLSDYSKRWSVDLDDANANLFSHLKEQDNERETRNAKGAASE